MGFQQREGRVPVVAVTGTVGKSTVAQLLDNIVRAAGRRTVMWLDVGVSIDGQLQVGELLPWSRGLQMVIQGLLDIAIQELPSAMVQAVGLPERTYQAAVVTNLTMNAPVSMESTATRGQLAANETVAAAVHPTGRIVLNADDRAVADLCTVSRAAPIFWALRRQSPVLVRHLRAGGSGLYIADGQIVCEVSGEVYPLAALAHVPVTLGGKAMFQVQNILAAAGGALAVGLVPEKIAAVLPSLTTSTQVVERSIELETSAFCRVVVARAPDLLALRELARMMKRLAPGAARSVGSVAWLAAYQTLHVADVVRLLAQIYRLVYLHGPESAQAATQVSEVQVMRHPPTMCVPVGDETEAIGRLLKLAASGDTLLILTENVPAAVTLIDSYGPRA